MSMPPCARSLWPYLAALLVLLGGGLPEGTGQALKAPEPDPALPPPDPVLLTTDLVLRRKLDAAQDYIKVRSWAEAVRLLQGVLDAPEDAFLKVTPAGARAKGVAKWVSARAEAERLLAALPPAGREFYELTHEASARKLLARAKAGGDRAALQEVARRFRFTRAGAEAQGLLGTYHLDRGRPELAAACFQRLLEGTGRGGVPPPLLFQAAVAFHAAGNTAQEEPTWVELMRQLRGEGLRLGTRTLPAEDLRRVAQGMIPPPGPVEDWLLYRGDARRAARGAVAPFLLQLARSIPTAEGEAREWLQRAGRVGPFACLPSATPLAVAGRIVYRAADGIHALEADTGRELWRAASPLALEALLRDPGKKVQLQHWFNLYGPSRGLLCENSTLGTLSSDGRQVYAVEDVALPPHPDLIAAQLGGLTRSLGPLRQDVQQNRLRAIDLATGAIRWEIGGPSPSAERGTRNAERKQPGSRAPRAVLRAPRPADPLAGAYFLGPPLPLGGDLFVLIDKEQDLSLVCLDPESGGVRWMQPLAAAGDRMGVNVLRRTHAAHLAYGGGVLVCPTHSGAVLGVDPLTRSLRWAHVYRQAAPTDGEAPSSTAAVPTAWRGSAPEVSDGRVVFTAPDSDAVVCLRLRDGEPLWKTLKTDDDLFVAGVFGDKVLVVGRTACRALSLAGGQTVWQRATGLPGGQGVAAGGLPGSAALHPGLYYLPLADGAVLALDVEDPQRTVRIEPRPGAPREAAGNLVFHRGILWSQGALQLTAYQPLDDRLARVEQRLAAAPEDGAALAERGRLRLEKGDVAGAAADLHAALGRLAAAEERGDTAGRLYAALGLLLQRDFSGGEKYLDEYRRLGARVPSAGRPPDDNTRHQRRQQLRALVARGRESQRRIADALREYAELLDSARPDELLAVPEDPALRVRPDVWVRGQVAALAGHSRGSRVLNAEIERRWREIEAGPPPGDTSDPRLARFLALFGGVTEGPGASLARTARLRWAQDCTQAPYRPHAIDADLLLRAAEREEGGAGPTPAAGRALEARARLLLRQGLLEEAAACYRRLGTAFAQVEIGAGRTGADALAEAALDKRLLAVGDVTRPPPVVRWPAGRMKVAELPGRGASDMLVVPLVPRQPWAPASPGSLGTGAPSPFVRGLRFFLDGRSLQLRAVDRNSGLPRFAIPLPLANFPAYLRSGELPCQAVDHLLVVAAGPTLLGIDLLECRVRWSRNMLDEASARGQVVGVLPDGTFWVNLPDNQPMRQLGWVGPAGPDGLCIHNRDGLTCLDTASGAVRWARTDVPAQMTVFGDGEQLYLAEHNGAEGIRRVRAVRLADGAPVAIPDATAAYAHRVRVVGRRLLVSEEGPNREMHLRLYDLPTGKDVWAKDFPAGSVLLAAPLAEWAGVAAPDGTVTVVDLEAGRELLRLALDRRHLEKVTAAQVFADAEQIYVALQGPGDGITKILDGPNPFFRAGLASAPVHGVLYAFDRSSGTLHWYSTTPAQSILLERFDELPLILCAATGARQGLGPGEAVGYVAFRSIDKRTGKVVCNRDSQQVGEPFHTLQLDPRGGIVDLIGPALVLRHQVGPKH